MTTRSLKTALVALAILGIGTAVAPAQDAQPAPGTATEQAPAAEQKQPRKGEAKREMRKETRKELKGDVAERMNQAPGKIEFFAQNQGYKAQGEFRKWRYTNLVIDKANPANSVAEIEIDMSSVLEKSPKLTDHLKASDMLNVAQFPKGTIKIHGIQVADAASKSYTAQADLTLLGVTQTYPVDFKVVSEQPMKIEGAATIKRGAYNIYTPFDASNPRSPEDDVKIKFSSILPGSGAKEEIKEKAKQKGAEMKEKGAAAKEKGAAAKEKAGEKAKEAKGRKKAAQDEVVEVTPGS